MLSAKARVLVRACHHPYKCDHSEVAFTASLHALQVSWLLYSYLAIIVRVTLLSHLDKMDFNPASRLASKDISHHEVSAHLFVLFCIHVELFCLIVVCMFPFVIYIISNCRYTFPVLTIGWSWMAMPKNAWALILF